MNGKPEAQGVLPPIPAKRYFTIGEVSELCGVKPHVLRYWEQEFTQLRPMKRRGNRRYYQHHEVLLVRRIRELLYEEGFTINGARNRLSEMGGGRVRATQGGLEALVAAPGDDSPEDRTQVGSHDVPTAASGSLSAPPRQSTIGPSGPAPDNALASRRTSGQQALPFSIDTFDGQQAVREALKQALDLLR